MTVDGNPWFVAADVCEVLGFKKDRGNHSYQHAYRRLAPDQLGFASIPRGQNSRKMRTLSESGLYDLILRSDKPVAKPFRKWVTREVIPSIRKTGSYQLGAGQRTPMRTAAGQA